MPNAMAMMDAMFAYSADSPNLSREQDNQRMRLSRHLCPSEISSDRFRKGRDKKDTDSWGLIQNFRPVTTLAHVPC